MGKIAFSLWIILVVFLVACASEPETPEVISEPAPPEVVSEPETPEVTFDEDGCSYSGPTELQTGLRSIVSKNLLGQGQEAYLDLDFSVGPLPDGYTYQDFLDLQSEPGAYFPNPGWPGWRFALIPSEPWTWDESAGARIYNWRLEKAGEYVMWFTRPRSPLGSWICGSFQAVEAAGE